MTTDVTQIPRRIVVVSAARADALRTAFAGSGAEVVVDQPLPSLRAPGPIPANRVTTVRRDAVKVGRNDPCPCGSGKKFKKCCEK